MMSYSRICTPFSSARSLARSSGTTLKPTMIVSCGEVGHAVERVVGVGHLIEAGDAHRYRRAGFVDRLAEVVVQRADAAVASPADHHVAAVQHAFLHQQGRLNAFTFTKVGFEADAA